MNFKAIVDKDFISRRNVKIAEDTRTDVNPYFQWDSEFVEFHQCKVDSFQTEFKGYEADTIHQMLGNIDYKLYRGSDGTCHVSPYIQKAIKNGITEQLGIWMWNGKYPGPLQEGQTVEYTILGYIDAKQALKHIDKKTNRIPYPLPENDVDEDIDIYDILREMPSMAINKAEKISLAFLESWQPKTSNSKIRKDKIVRDIKNACTSTDICGIMYRINLRKEGLGTVGSAWQKTYREI